MRKPYNFLLRSSARAFPQSITVLCLSMTVLTAVRTLHAEIVSEAMLTFPASTESIEYDNLYELRRLPNYSSLRRRFAGKPLEQATAALSRLGINEAEVHEIVIGAGPGALYGLLSGTFSASLVTRTARTSGFSTHLMNAAPEAAYCPIGGSCFVFLEESLAVFGTLSQLEIILEARLGGIPRLSSNRTLAYLMSGTQPRAPVRGAVYGSRLNAILTDALGGENGLNLDLTSLSSKITALGYSIKMDTKAHVAATLQCQSATTAAVLRHMLNVLGGVQSAASKVSQDPATMPFQNMQVSASGNQIEMMMDTKLPTP